MASHWPEISRKKKLPKAKESRGAVFAMTLIHQLIKKSAAQALSAIMYFVCLSRCACVDARKPTFERQPQSLNIALQSLTERRGLGARADLKMAQFEVGGRLTRGT